MLQALRPRLRPGAAVLISDFQGPLRGDPEAEPVRFGGSLAHPVDFRIFDAFAASAGFGVTRTKGTLRSVHIAAVYPDGPAPRAVRSGFRRAFVLRHENEDMIDFTAAAAQADAAGEPELAARLYRRCLRHAPTDAELAYRFGRSLLRAGAYELAARALSKGLALPGAREYDFVAQLRRAQRGLRLMREAARTAPGGV